MAKQKIRIRLKSYDHRVLDQSVKQIVDIAEKTGAIIVGPVPLPTQIEKFTVMRSTFIRVSSLQRHHAHGRRDHGAPSETMAYRALP